MKVCVYVMRRDGRHWNDRDRKGVEGELRLHSITHGGETHKVLQLCARKHLSSNETELLPPLYAPELVALGSGSLLLRGFESRDGIGFVQEWHCIVD